MLFSTVNRNNNNPFHQHRHQTQIFVSDINYSIITGYCYHSNILFIAFNFFFSSIRYHQLRRHHRPSSSLRHRINNRRSSQRCQQPTTSHQDTNNSSLLASTFYIKSLTPIASFTIAAAPPLSLSSYSSFIPINNNRVEQVNNKTEQGRRQDTWAAPGAVNQQQQPARQSLANNKHFSSHLTNFIIPQYITLTTPSPPAPFSTSIAPLQAPLTSLCIKLTRRNIGPSYLGSSCLTNLPSNKTDPPQIVTYYRLGHHHPPPSTALLTIHHPGVSPRARRAAATNNNQVDIDIN